MLNETLNYLYAHTSVSMLCFSGQTGNVSVDLNGPGGLGGDGFPFPTTGMIRALRLWDGVTDRSDSDEIAVAASDRLSVYCQDTGPDFTVKVRVNGASTNLEIPNVPFNSVLYASVEVQLLMN
jgi:hypothetical protein